MALRPLKRRHALGLIAASWALACQGKAGGDGKAEGGAAQAQFTGKSIKGEYLSLEDYRGKVVLLNIWATWCGPCRQELPELRRLHHAYADQGFMVLGISVDKERDFNKVQALVREFKLDYPIIFDPSSSAVGTFNVRGYPTSILLDRTGATKWRRDGLIRPSDDEATAHIEAALAAPQ